MTPGAEIELGPHWWKASALTTRPTLPPPEEYQKFSSSGNIVNGQHLCQGVILEMFNLMERNNLTWESMII